MCCVIKFQLTFNTTLEAKGAVGVFTLVTGKLLFSGCLCALNDFPADAFFFSLSISFSFFLFYKPNILVLS